MVNKQLQFDMRKIKELSHKWHVVRLAFFGSVLRYDFGLKSDVDVLIDFEKNSSVDLFDFVSMLV